MGAFLPQQGRTQSQPQAEGLELLSVSVPDEDFVQIPENFFGGGGEEDVTI